MIRLSHLPCILLVLVILSCKEKGTSEILISAERIIEQYPDSALSLLESHPIMDLSKEDYYRYRLPAITNTGKR